MELTDTETTLQQLIANARREGTAIPGKDANRGVDLDSAYRIQAASQGDRVLKGYKFGLISPAKQAQMGIDVPLYGRIYADMVHQNGVSLSGFIQPRFEPEVALVLRDPIPSDSSAGQVARAIGGYFLGIDILDSVWQGYQFTAPEVVADNTSGGGFLLAGRMREAMPGGTLRMYINGDLVAEGHLDTLGNPVQRLQWLARMTGGLDAGMMIFFGSPAAAVPAQAGALEVADSEGNMLVARIDS